MRTLTNTKLTCNTSVVLAPWSIHPASAAKLGLLILLVLAVTGCGGGGGTGSGETTPTAPESRPTTYGASQTTTALSLATAGEYAILAGGTITNVAPSQINGDVGSSHSAEPSLRLTCAQVRGTIYAGDVVAPQACGHSGDILGQVVAQTDLARAYEDAETRSQAAVALAGDIGGQTLSPGLYKSTQSLQISAADLVLDAHGDASAVWVFRISGTLHAGPARHVFLRGGAKAANVYWQVGSSVTLAEDTDFKGSILAYDSITLLAGARLEGRALARTGTVSLTANSISRPVP